MEEALSERRKVSTATHGSDENRQAYISASRPASSVIATAKAEAWQATCSSLSPKSVRFLLPPLSTSPTVSLPGSGFGLR